MTVDFYKYQGTGNDFVILDQFNKQEQELSVEQVNQICDRKFGVGADGLIILSKSDQFDFSMKYYNADGNESSMCGNGGRCIVHLAKQLGIFDKSVQFDFQGKKYFAQAQGETISLKMQDVNNIDRRQDAFVLDTGSPHFVEFCNEDIRQLDIAQKGAQVRYNAEFRENGINVNFVNVDGKGIVVGTYERGVEDETLSCGTGVVACAISFALKTDLKVGHHVVPIKTKGGDLSVEFDKSVDGFSNIFLNGPAKCVFTGTIVV